MLQILACINIDEEHEVSIDNKIYINHNKKEPGAFVTAKCPDEETRYIKYFGLVDKFTVPGKLNTDWLSEISCKNNKSPDLWEAGFYACAWEYEGIQQGGKKAEDAGTLTEDQFKILTGDWLYLVLTAKASAK